MNDELSLLIRHQTGFTYAGLAIESYNEARMTPVTTKSQDVVWSTLRVDPAVEWNSYVDYFGSTVSTFEVHEPHHQLEVEAVSVVRSRGAELSVPLSWREFDDSNFLSNFAEYLTKTKRSTIEWKDFVELSVRARERDVHEGVELVANYVREEMDYLRGVTTVSSTAQEAWDRRAGVCQDITHVTIGVLRAMGVPARYVSGYLYPSTLLPAGQVTSGESHAWVEYFSGEWTGIDPTNGLRESAHHVLVGRGRDYDDVPPLKGIYEGPPVTHLGVTVDMAIEID